MSMQTWAETLISAQTDGTALTNSTTATSVLPAAAKFTIPANYFQIGRVVRVNAWGRISNVVTTPGNLTLDVRFGSTVVFNGGAMALNTTAKTNVSWRAIVMLTCRSIGSGTSATLLGMGDWCSESATGSAAGTANDILMPASAPAVGTGFDSTSAQVMDLFATFSVASASNSIQLHEYTVEAMN